jgi:fatty acid desaturase
MSSNAPPVAAAVPTTGAAMDGVDPALLPPRWAGKGFLELSRLVKEEDLLRERPAAYVGKLALNTALIVGGLVAFVLVGDSWWQLAVAAWMGFAGVQSAFMWHDAAHKSMFRSKRLASAVGYFHANLVNGVSYGWWVNHHNRHHSHPNHLELDPDIGRRTAIFHLRQWASRHGVQRFVARHQHVLFFVLLVQEGYKMHRTAVKSLFDGSVKHRKLEGTLLFAHAAIYLGSVFYLLSPGKAVAFVVVQQVVLGVYFGMLFAPNHKGMEVRWENELEWLPRQVLTSRNIRPSTLVDFLYGGLNYQVEHHLFPTMPQMNLSRCRKIVMAYCEGNGIRYHEVGVLASYQEVYRYLKQVSAPLRRHGALAAS